MAVPLKHLSNFWRSLQMALINCKIHHELDWTKDCIMSVTADTAFKITKTQSYTHQFSAGTRHPGDVP